MTPVHARDCARFWRQHAIALMSDLSRGFISRFHIGQTISRSGESQENADYLTVFSRKDGYLALSYRACRAGSNLGADRRPSATNGQAILSRETILACEWRFDMGAGSSECLTKNALATFRLKPCSVGRSPFVFTVWREGAGRVIYSSNSREGRVFNPPFHDCRALSGRGDWI